MTDGFRQIRDLFGIIGGRPELDLYATAEKLARSEWFAEQRTELASFHGTHCADQTNDDQVAEPVRLDLARGELA